VPSSTEPRQNVEAPTNCRSGFDFPCLAEVLWVREEFASIFAGYSN
jgi:hypothetical protein